MKRSLILRRSIAFLLSVAVLWLTIGFVTFHQHDSSFISDSSYPVPVHNYAGYIGAWVVAVLLFLGGSASFFVVIMLLMAVYYYAVDYKKTTLLTKLVGISIGGFLMMIFCHHYALELYAGIVPGGVLGSHFDTFLRIHVDEILIRVLFLVTFFMAILLVGGRACVYGLFKSISYGIRLFEYCSSMVQDKLNRVLHTKKVRTPVKKPVPAVSKYALSLQTIFPLKQQVAVPENWRQRAAALEHKLQSLGIFGRVINVQTGPVVTLFSYEPEITTKVHKILALEHDIALALQAQSLRIIAPIPGQSVVGFEVANVHRSLVWCTEILRGDTYKKSTAEAPLIVGKNTIGEDIIIDLTKAPHILVAGSTGSGKSVALNGMLVSLLCRCSPDDVRLIIIDPKRLEFSLYADIPHLLFPIITEVSRAASVLQWCIKTMEERYQKMAQINVRSIQEYNELNKEKKMPFIVVIIDELADLMMAVGQEIELRITRLAQMARAAGIHLIVATQRPSVDVITGLIKVNFPLRIAFKVISKIDSRTILDCAGAEKLLGKGDMLFLNEQGLLQRAHGAYIADTDIVRLIAYLKEQRAVHYVDLDRELQEISFIS